MENRLRSKRRLKTEKSICGALKKARKVIDSCGEESLEYSIPAEYFQESKTMTDNGDAVREVGRMMTDVLTRQIEVQQEREEANVERLTQLVERQVNYHRVDANKLTEQFEKMRLDKEKEADKF